MLFSDNPFYVLELSCFADRREIVKKVDELSFYNDPQKCANAHTDLMNPTKRLSAELGWFYNCNDITEIIKCIQNNEKLPTDDLYALPRINALLYNFEIASEKDIFKISDSILKIDEQFEKLDVDLMVSDINRCRDKSQIKQVVNQEINSELTNIRAIIRRTITQSLRNLSDPDYVELVTMIAKKCIVKNDYDDGVVINDLIDQYEIRMQLPINEMSRAIIETANRITPKEQDGTVNAIIDKLIQMLYKWDKYAQPLQVKSMMMGIDHEQSLTIAVKLRELAINLHNEYHNTNASSKMIKALVKVFSELSGFAEILNKDDEQMKKIMEENNKNEREKASHRQTDKVYSVNICNDKFAFPPLCTCCMKPTANQEKVSYSESTQKGNTRTKRSIEVNMPICNDCLKHRSRYRWLLVMVCSISIIVGCSLFLFLTHSVLDKSTNFVICCVITSTLYYWISTIWKTSSLSVEHSTRGKSAKIITSFSNDSDNQMYSQSGNKSKRKPDVTFTFTNWEYAQLFYEANKDYADPICERYETNTGKSTSILVANEHRIINMFKMLGIFTAILFILGDFINETSSSNVNEVSAYVNTNNDFVAVNSNGSNASSYSQSSSIDNSNITSSKSTQTNTTELYLLKAEIAEIESKLILMKSEIDLYIISLDNLSDDIDNNESQYKLTGDDVYYNAYYKAVDDYDDIYIDYSNKVDEYNTLFATYSATVDEYNRKVESKSTKNTNVESLY